MDATKTQRGHALALEDLQLKPRADADIAEEWGLSERTVQRVRETKEYEEAVAALTTMNPLLTDRIVRRATEIFFEGFEKLEAIVKGTAKARPETMLATMKYLQELAGIKPGAPQEASVSVPAGGFPPNQILIQQATFIQQQAEAKDPRASEPVEIKVIEGELAELSTS